MRGVFACAVLVGCGSVSTQTLEPVTASAKLDPCSETSPSLGSFRYGIAHVAGHYGSEGGESFLRSGADRVLELGARDIKVFLTPTFAEKYPGEVFDETPTSLVTLAQSRTFDRLFAMPFDTFLITTYSFSNGMDGSFQNGFTDAQADAEYAEVRALADHLLTRFAGTGKRFVLQNWEGDWAVLGKYDEEANPTDAALAGMRRWLEARQQAITDARQAAGDTGATVIHSVELNLLLDAQTGKKRVFNSILPYVCVDAVAYSAYEALYPAYADNPEKVRSQLTEAVRTIRAATKKPTQVFFGELGFAENEMRADVAEKAAEWLDVIASTARELDAGPAFYWQVFDNECTGETCRGFGLVQRDGSLSRFGAAISQQQ